MKNLWVIAAVLVAGLGTFLIWNYNRPQATPSNATAGQNDVSAGPSSSNIGSQNTSESPNVSNNQPPTNQSQPAQNPKTVIISITDSGFSPNSITITKGDSVKWINNSSVPSHPASDPHPAHNGYPTTGGCVGSTFDACSALQPGDSWTFKFDFTGSWGYHDHVNPSMRGTVIVTQ